MGSTQTDTVFEEGLDSSLDDEKPLSVSIVFFVITAPNMPGGDHAFGCVCVFVYPSTATLANY